MIDKALEFLVTELDGFLKLRFPVPSDAPHASLAALSEADGDGAERLDKRLLVALVNIEREAAAPAPPGGARAGGGFAIQAPALHLNVYVLVAAAFKGEPKQALQMLSGALAFFQGRQQFARPADSGLPQGVERLQLELVSLNLSELNSLWSILGAKYMPSALYRVRMLTIDQQWMSAAVPEVLSAQSTVGR